MDARKTLMVAAALSALTLWGIACEAPSLSDSIEPVNRYLNQFVGSGATAIQIYESPAHYFGQVMNLGSIDNLTVKLERASDGAAVGGDVSGFDFAACLSGGTIGCPRGIGFRPGGLLTPCDLDGDTTYQLIIDGVVLDDGSALPPVTFIFRTQPVPAGYPPNFCSTAGPITWWTIEDGNSTDGLNGGIAADAVTTYLAGVQDSATSGYDGYDYINDSGLKFCQVSSNSFIDLSSPEGPNVFPYPPYIAVLEILNNGGSAYDLSASAGTIQIKDISNNIMNVRLPDDSIPAGEALFLYVANNGSTYYMFNSVTPGVHTFDPADPDPIGCGFNCCDFSGVGCPTMDPPTAFSFLPAAP